MLYLHALLYYSSTQSPWSQSCVLFVMLLSHHLFKLKSQGPLATNPPSLFATQTGHALLFKWKPLFSILHTLLWLQVCYPPFTCELFKLESQTPLVKNPQTLCYPKTKIKTSTSCYTSMALLPNPWMPFEVCEAPFTYDQLKLRTPHAPRTNPPKLFKSYPNIQKPTSASCSPPVP